MRQRRMLISLATVLAVAPVLAACGEPVEASGPGQVAPPGFEDGFDAEPMPGLASVGIDRSDLKLLRLMERYRPFRGAAVDPADRGLIKTLERFQADHEVQATGDLDPADRGLIKMLERYQP